MDRELGITGFEQRTDEFNGIYRGKVVDNNDPDMLGRIKVQVYPMLADIEAAGLPWAVPAPSLFVGAGESMGCFAVPANDTHVFIFFESGDMYQPVYFAEAPTRTLGLPTSRVINYPTRKVWRSVSKITMILDDTDYTTKIVHPTGTTVLIDQNGKVIINSVDDVIITGATVQINPATTVATGVPEFGRPMFGSSKFGA